MPGKNDATGFEHPWAKPALLYKKRGYRQSERKAHQILWVVSNNMSNYFYVRAAYFYAARLSGCWHGVLKRIDRNLNAQL